MAFTKIFACMLLVCAGSSAADCVGTDEVSLIQVKKDMKLGSESMVELVSATNIDAKEQKVEQPLIGAPAPVTRDATWVKTYLGVDLNDATKKAKSTDYLAYGVGLPPPAGNSALKSLSPRVLCTRAAVSTQSALTDDAVNPIWTSTDASDSNVIAANPCNTAGPAGGLVEEGTYCLMYRAAKGFGKAGGGAGDPTHYCTSPGLCQADGNFANTAPICAATQTCAGLPAHGCTGTCGYDTIALNGGSPTTCAAGANIKSGTICRVNGAGTVGKTCISVICTGLDASGAQASSNQGLYKNENTGEVYTTIPATLCT